MIPDAQNDDLRSAFRQLRADDAEAVRDFDKSLEPRRSWRVRRAAIGTSLACLAVAAALIITNPWREEPSVVAAPVLEEIAFDELSELIEQALVVVTVSEWRSPTSFLLNPET